MKVNDVVFKVTSRGVTAPAYKDVYDTLVSRVQGIFGTDVNLDADTPDGQLVAIVAKAISDVNAEAVRLHADFSPATATGVGLDLAVKTNGLVRGKAVGSTVDLKLVGQGGTIVRNGEAMDENRNRWILPDEVRIPPSGEIVVTARAKDDKAFEAAAGAIRTIATPTRGWQSVTNEKPAIVGIPVERDSQLRERQAVSTAKPSRSIWEGVIGSILDLEGVKRVSGIRNNDDAPTREGVPGHSIALIVDGGDVTEIAETIFMKGGEGTGTHGDITTTILDKYEFPQTVRFSRPKTVNVHVTIKVKPSDTYVTSVEDVIKERIVSYISKLRIGEGVNLMRVMATAIKEDNIIDDRFEVEELKLGRSSSSLSPSSVAVAWNEAAFCELKNVRVDVVEA